MANWYEETFKGTRLSLEITETFFSGTSEFQKIEIFNTVEYGRTMAIDNVFMTSEGDEFIYHEMLVHPALLTANEPPKRVLVIGGGDGGTVREVLRHPSVEECVMIEIDELVVQACKAHLPTIGTAWDDPRLDVRFIDGIDYVKNTDDEKYDVVLLDGTDPIGPGEVLFDIEFFRGCKRMMKPGAVLALQSETPALLRDVFFETQAKLRSLWKSVHPYFAGVPIYASGSWSWTWCSDGGSPTALETARSDGRLDAIEATSRYYNEAVHRGALARPNYIQKGLASL